MCSMHSYQTSFGALLWTEDSISESKVGSFYEPKKGGRFVLKKFNSIDEANKLRMLLRQHNHFNCAFPMSIFTVEGEDGWFLALSKRGVSLKDYLDEADVQVFYEDDKISEFYQQILITLLLVVRHFMDTEIECALDISDIFVWAGVEPFITLTNFKWRGPGGFGSNDDCKKLVPIIKSINEKIAYETRGNKEMSLLIQALDNPTWNSLSGISALPLFWSKADRSLFPSCLLCFLRAQINVNSYPKEKIYVNGHQLSGNSAIGSVDNDAKLKQLIEFVDSYAAPGLNNKREVAKCFAQTFGFLEMHHLALGYEFYFSTRLLPRVRALENLYKDPDKDTENDDTD